MKIYVKSVDYGPNWWDGLPQFTNVKRGITPYRLSYEECKMFNSFPEWVKNSATEFAIDRPSRGPWRVYKLKLDDGRTFEANTIKELRDQLNNI